MYTPTSIAARIAAAAVARFATDNGIVPAHLSTDPDALTPAEVARASRALGSEVVFDGR